MNKSIYRLLLIAVVAFTSLAMNAQDYHLRHDTIYVYKSWESILDQWADTILVNPEIEVYSPSDVDFFSLNEAVDKMLRNEAVALAIGDTTWFVSSYWLQRNFKGQSHKMDDWVPLYFTAKIAFVQWSRTKPSLVLSVFGGLLGDPDLFAPAEDEYGDLYLIDFDNASLDKIDHKYLSHLLESYPDLQRRYLMMKDYKKPYIIQSFFIDYINRLNDDPTVPFIVE